MMTIDYLFINLFYKSWLAENTELVLDVFTPISIVGLYSIAVFLKVRHQKQPYHDINYESTEPIDRK